MTPVGTMGRGGNMRIKPWLGAVMCVIVVAAAGAGSAFAGEVKGPPGSSAAPADPNYTGARTNSNSICSYSGQNDYHPADEVGRTAEHVQNWGQIPKDVRDFLTSIGESPGAACQGGSNHNRSK